MVGAGVAAAVTVAVAVAVASDAANYLKVLLLPSDVVSGVLFCNC